MQRCRCMEAQALARCVGMDGWHILLRGHVLCGHLMHVLRGAEVALLHNMPMLLTGFHAGTAVDPRAHPAHRRRP